MENKRVIVAGATGLVGKEVVKQLILDSTCHEIIVLVRKSSEIKHPKIKEIIFNFTSQEYQLEDIQADSMLICIGTTMKKAGTKESFKNVDLYIPLKLAKLAKKIGIHNLSVISAMGADSKSSFFYNKVKGDMENQLISLQLPNLSIFRPSLLIGEREEFRFGERLAEKLYRIAPFIFPKKYEPVEANQVAKAIISKVNDNQKVMVIENALIHEISRNI